MYLNSIEIECSLFVSVDNWVLKKWIWTQSTIECSKIDCWSLSIIQSWTIEFDLNRLELHLKVRVQKLIVIRLCQKLKNSKLNLISFNNWLSTRNWQLSAQKLTFGNLRIEFDLNRQSCFRKFTFDLCRQWKVKF